MLSRPIAPSASPVSCTDFTQDQWLSQHSLCANPRLVATFNPPPSSSSCAYQNPQLSSSSQPPCSRAWRSASCFLLHFRLGYNHATTASLRIPQVGFDCDQVSVTNPLCYSICLDYCPLGSSRRPDSHIAITILYIYTSTPARMFNRSCLEPAGCAAKQEQRQKQKQKQKQEEKEKHHQKQSIPTRSRKECG